MAPLPVSCGAPGGCLKFIALARAGSRLFELSLRQVCTLSVSVLAVVVLCAAVRCVLVKKFAELGHLPGFFRATCPAIQGRQLSAGATAGASRSGACA